MKIEHTSDVVAAAERKLADKTEPAHSWALKAECLAALIQHWEAERRDAMDAHDAERETAATMMVAQYKALRLRHNKETGM